MRKSNPKIRRFLSSWADSDCATVAKLRLFPSKPCNSNTGGEELPVPCEVENSTCFSSTWCCAAEEESCTEAGAPAAAAADAVAAAKVVDGLLDDGLSGRDVMLEKENAAALLPIVAAAIIVNNNNIIEMADARRRGLLLSPRRLFLAKPASSADVSTGVAVRLLLMVFFCRMRVELPTDLRNGMLYTGNKQQKRKPNKTFAVR